MHRLAGHAARSSSRSVLFSAVHWRNQSWWREQQLKIMEGATFFRRPSPGKPVSWELELELMHGQNWFELAVDRAQWRDLETWYATRGLSV
eukprot:6813678-Heterocapsa_arctica.AAC.1